MKSRLIPYYFFVENAIVKNTLMTQTALTQADRKSIIIIAYLDETNSTLYSCIQERWLYQ